MGATLASSAGVGGAYCCQALCAYQPRCACPALRRRSLQSLASRLRAPSASLSQSRLRVGPGGASRLPTSLDGSAAPSGAATPGRWGGASASGAGGGSAPGHGGQLPRASVAGGMPEEFLHDPSKYPVPLIPFLKCG